MEPGHGDPDTDIRIAAFARLRSLSHGAGGALPWSAIAQGFLARGRRFLFATTAEGIFRPVGMTGVLSIKTVVPNPKGRIWYHDQSSPDLSRGSDVFWYAFTGPDPNSTRNRWLHHAMVQQLPLIYFFGVAPALYEPLFPTFVVEWNPTRLSCGLSFASSFSAQAQISAPAPLRAQNRAAEAAPGSLPRQGHRRLWKALRPIWPARAAPDRCRSHRARRPRGAWPARYPKRHLHVEGPPRSL